MGGGASKSKAAQQAQSPAPQPEALQPSNPQPAVPEPAVVEPPAPPQPALQTNSADEPAAAHPAALQPSAPQPSTPQPSPPQSSPPKPSPPQPAPPQRSATQSSAAQPLNGKLEELFNKIDGDQSGDLSKHELQGALQELTELVSPFETPQLTALIDSLSSTHLVSRDDFRAAVRDAQTRQLAKFFSSIQAHEILAMAVMQSKAMQKELEADLDPLKALKALTAETQKATMVDATQHLTDSANEALNSSQNWRGEQLEPEEDGSSSKKFADCLFGHLGVFYQGLDGLIGLPNPNVLQAMRLEHSSDEQFRAYNNGQYYHTTVKAEWERMLDANEVVCNTDRAGNVMCKDFMQHERVIKAGLTKPEVLALRLYTGPLFSKYNGKLRSMLKSYNKLRDTMTEPEALSNIRKELGTGYVTTIHAISSALQKLSKITVLPPDRKVFRGMAGLNMPECFRVPDSYGCRGGVEFGFMSTSTEREQAVTYIKSDKGMPTLFEIEMGQVDRGSELHWISQFPGEAEVLLPPLSNLEVVGDPRLERTRKGFVTVWPLRLNVNLKGLTIEELEGRRKMLHITMFGTLISELQREFAFGPISVEKQEILEECSAILRDHEHRPVQTYNNDMKYKDALEEALRVRFLAPRKVAVLETRSAGGASEDEMITIRGTPLTMFSNDGVYFELLSGLPEFPWRDICEHSTAAIEVTVPASALPKQATLAWECIMKNTNTVQRFKYHTAKFENLRAASISESTLRFEDCDAFGVDAVEFVEFVYNFTPEIGGFEHVTEVCLSNCVLGFSGSKKMALMLKRMSGVVSLDLKGCLIGDQGIAAIQKHFQTKGQLTQLNVCGNGLCGKGLNTLSAILKETPGLKTLDIGHNPISKHLEAFSKFCEVIQALKALEELSLKETYLKNVQLDLMTSALKKSGILQKLNGRFLPCAAESWEIESAHQIRYEESQTIASWIKANKELKAFCKMMPSCESNEQGWDLSAKMTEPWLCTDMVLHFLSNRLVSDESLRVKIDDRIISKVNLDILSESIEAQNHRTIATFLEQQDVIINGFQGHDLMVSHASQGNVSICMLLMAAGKAGESQPDEEQQNVLLQLLAAQDISEIAADFFARSRPDLTEALEGGYTVAHMACLRGASGVLEVCVNAGGPEVVLGRDPNGFTTGHHAVLGKSAKVFGLVAAVGGPDLLCIPDTAQQLPCHLAVATPNEEAFVCLVVWEGGKQAMKAKNMGGQTSLELARLSDKPDLAAAMRRIYDYEDE